MNLSRKLEMARGAIASITRHDDASDAELAECASQLQKFLKEELAAAAARRERKREERLAKLKAG